MMKKLLLSITLLLCSAIGFAGFAGNNTDFNTETKPNRNTNVELDLFAEAEVNTVEGKLFSGGVLTVTTGSVNNITDTSAICSGEVTDIGGSSVTEKGIVWGTEENPTLIDNAGKTNNGNGPGVFSGTLTELAGAQTYYYRAYAKNIEETAYGEVKEFTSSYTDLRDNKLYGVIKIGDQHWMTENLNFGEMIDGTETQSNQGAIEKYCYNDEEANCDIYGGLYQWDNMMQFQAKEGLQGICPDGWRLPTDADWCILTSFLDATVDCSSTGWSGTDAGGKLKEAGTAHWSGNNTGATNSSGFTALGNGEKRTNEFIYLRDYGSFWSSTMFSSSQAWCRHLGYGGSNVDRTYRAKTDGFGVRCLRETPRTVTTNNAVNITTTSAVCGGAVLEDNGYPITEKGIVLSRNPMPTINGPNTITSTHGSGLGSFSSTIGGLGENTRYYIRAWATSSQGTTYGNEVEFTTLFESCEGLFTDTRQGGQDYSMVRIGKQCWMAENLNYGVRVYSSENMSDNSVIEKYCYNNEEDSCTKYGGLYQWDEMMQYVKYEGGQGICPHGWHLPSDAEWAVLHESVRKNPENICGNSPWAIAKTLSDSAAWEESNTACAVGNELSQNNATGFAVLPAGSRHNDGTFFDGNLLAKMWSSTQTDFTSARRWHLVYNSPILHTQDYEKSFGQSVRCLRGNLPTVHTDSMTGVTKVGAAIYGNVTSIGGSDITARGVCWGLMQNPTIENADSKQDGTGTGTMYLQIEGLTHGTLYYLRAYATNNDGTAYGEQIEFFTLFECSEVLIDSRDDKTYTTVKIGDQCWMNENLNVGTKIESWNNQSNNNLIEKYCYNNDTTKCDAYGGLYQWNEVMQYETFEAAQGICPPGWHLPTDEEWCTLENNVDEPNTIPCDVAGWRGLSQGSILQQTGSNNFKGLMAGKRQEYITFQGLGDSCYWWSSTKGNNTKSWRRHIATSRNKINRYTASNLNAFSVRCLKGSLPTLVTTSVSSITDSSAISGGVVVYNGDRPVTARGVCWSKSPNPDINDNKINNNSGVGSFTSEINGLSPGITYYLRAYATSDVGTVYGSQKVFETNAFVCGTKFTDRRDNQLYTTVQLGKQCWMAENLNHGVRSLGHLDQTNNDTIEKYAYNADETNWATYGGLYQWDEMMQYQTTPGVQGICPDGWHLPTDDEWTELTDFVEEEDSYWCDGDEGNIAKALSDITTWNNTPTACAPGNDQTSNNATGFGARASGKREVGVNPTQRYGGINEVAIFWTSTQKDNDDAKRRFINYADSTVWEDDWDKKRGHSVRCVRTALPIIKTRQVFNITPDSAKVMGEVISSGGVDITERGVCIGLAPYPTINSRKVIDEGEDNLFVVNIDGLNPLALYYARTFATSESGTTYGVQWVFKYAFCGNRIGDFRDEPVQIYNTKKIGEQCWMAENLNVGNKITGSTNQTYNSSIEKYCYDDEDDNCEEYGGLYQWYEMMQYNTTPGMQGICPDGWYLPTDADWCTLENEVDDDPPIECGTFGGRDSDGGGKLKEADTKHWNSPNTGATNSSGFIALGGSYRGTDGGFGPLKSRGIWWTSDFIDASNSLTRELKYDSDQVFRNPGNVLYSFSVRCVKVELPSLSTKAVKDISHTTATSGGNISHNGGRPVTARGLCWSDTQNPTIENNTTDVGPGMGEFTDTIRGLTKNTKYFVRAYATTVHGTAYGDERSFSTSFACGDTLSDPRDGQLYPTLHLGNKCWMTANLNYGEQIDGSADQIQNGITEKYCYNNDEDMCDTYGGLYQWNEMMQYTTLEGEQGICPTGWHLPTKTEWTALATYTNENQDYQCDNTSNFIAKSLASKTNWHESEIDCTPGNLQNDNNATGFNAMPGGRWFEDSFSLESQYGIWWTSTQDDDDNTLAWRRFMIYNETMLYPGHPDKSFGYSVRCVMGDLPIVSIDPINSFSDVNASMSGEVSFDGGMEVTSRGFCVNTEPNPNISNTHTSNGSGIGIFEANISGLAPGQKYYVRAYATNSVGTAYSTQLEFTTSTIGFTCNNFFTDIRDNKSYATIQIGEQCWMAENLNIGTRINAPDDQTDNGTIEKYCFDNKEDSCNAYGGLYRWNEMMQHQTNEGVQGICPDGWYLPTKTDWNNLITHVKSVPDYWCDNNTNKYAKALAAKTSWKTNNYNCTAGSDLSLNNATGFTALPGGYFWFNHDFQGFSSLLQTAYWWSSSTHLNPYFDQADAVLMYYRSSDLSFPFPEKSEVAYSVRCMKGALPTVSTTEVADPTNSSASSGGIVIEQGSSPVTARGVCWSVLPNPTIYGNFTDDGTGIGNFTSTITGLAQLTTYYVRAYATNNIGTAYGEEVEFTTSIACADSIEDSRDGQKYGLVKIGDQCWMAQNLNIGERIDVLDEQTDNAVIEKYCYNDIEDSCNTYGGLYQWDEMMQYDTLNRGICPLGWYLPSNDDWDKLVDYLTSHEQYRCGTFDYSFAKSLASTSGWQVSSDFCTVGNDQTTNNLTGFNAYPAGMKDTGFTTRVSTNSFWWSNTKRAQTYPYQTRVLSSNGNSMNGWIWPASSNGFSVRCLRKGVYPTVSTSSANNATPGSVITGGHISADGGMGITVRGVCWSTTEQPTLEDSFTTDGAGIGTFSSTITGLYIGETYFVRAYATNGIGTAYGEQQTILTASVMSPSGNALVFDGNDDYVELPNEGEFDFTGSMTVEAWIKVDAFNRPYQAIVTKGDNSWRMQRDGDSNFITFGTNGLSTAKITSTSNVNDQNWHHVAFVYDTANKTTQIYVDGKLDSTNTDVTGNIKLNNHSVWIGGNSQVGNRWFYGSIDEVRIWDAARSVDELNEDMFRTLKGTEDNLVSYWSMNQSAGNILTDLTGKNHGILQNMDDDDWVSSGAFAGPRNGLDIDDIQIRFLFSRPEKGTVKFWLYPKPYNQDTSTIFYIHYTREWEMSIIANDTLSFTIDEPVKYSLNSLHGIEHWYHVALTWEKYGNDKISYSLFIDGVLRNTVTNQSSLNQGSSYCTIGKSANLNGKFIMDEFRLWSEMRTEQEIRENMSHSLTGNESNLLLYYRFDQRAGNKVYDASQLLKRHAYLYFGNSDNWIPSTAFNSWIGCTDNNWGTASNWSTQQVPNAEANVGIPYIAGGKDPSINNSYSCNNLTIETGATLFTTAGLVLSTFGNPYSYGTITGTAKVKMTGTSYMQYPGGNFVNLVLDNPAGANLSGDMTITGTLELAEGNMNQGSYNIILGELGHLAESGENRLSGTTGTISTSRTLHAGDLSEGKNIAGLGAKITTEEALGLTTITRGYSPQGTGQNSISRYYDIAPASNTGLNASLVFRYDSTKLNNNTAGSLKLYSSSDEGDTWQFRGGEVNEVNETISLDNLYSFSRWTASDSELGNALNAAFEADTTIGSTSFVVQFTDLSSYDNEDSVSWFWDFGNGNTSDSQTPDSQTYLLNGDDLTSYTVSLTITEADSSSMEIKEDYITVCPDNYWVGEVEGTWTHNESPYYVGGEIIVPLGDTLTIEPGVSVLFRPNSIDWQDMPEQPTRENTDFGFITVYGTLDVQGEKNDSVVFTRMGNNGAWGLVHMVDTANPGGEQISYLKMEHASYMYENDEELAGLCLDGSDITVSNSRFSNNYIGIQCDSSNAKIENNHLSENLIGIKLHSSAATISNNNILLNQTNGITCLNDTSSIIGNRIRLNVKNGLYCELSDTAEIANNIISENKNGIHSINSLGMLITNNEIMANTEYGILCKDDNTIISGNDISDNGINGIDFTHSLSMVSENDILNNALSGIYCELSDPSIEGNNITGNITGILCKNASKPQIEGNTISFNWAGIGCYEGSVPQILHNIIASNSNTGIDVASGAKATVVSNTIADNSGYGVYCYDDASVMIDNSILWDNGASIVIPSSATVSWSCVQGGYEGEENIIKAPMFTQKDNEKYHLTWSNFPDNSDAVHMSPCINTGNPDLNGNDTLWIDDPEDRDPDMSLPDMGARYFHQSPLVTIMYDNNEDLNSYEFPEQLFIPDVSEPKMFHVRNDADRLNECRLFFTDPPPYTNQFHLLDREPDTDTILILKPYALDSIFIVYEPTDVINGLESQVIVGDRLTYADSITLSGISIGTGTVQGNVTTTFNSPVEGVTIKVVPVYNPYGVFFSDQTDENGFYSVSNVGYGEFYVTPEFSEEVNGVIVVHEFNPDVSTVLLYTNVPSIRDFNDVSVFPVSGHIYFTDTDCPAENIFIKLDGAQVKNTDDEGYYNFGGVTLGQHVLTPEAAGHVFSPASDTLYVNTAIGSIDFHDNFTYNLSGYVAGAGGDCDTIPLAEEIKITISCTDECMNDRTCYTDSTGFYSINLPPFEYEVKPQDTTYLNYGYPGEPLAEKWITFDAVEVDLTKRDTIQNFFWHSEPVIEIIGLDSVTNAYGMVVLEQLKQYWVDIKVYEPYRDAQGELYKCLMDTGEIVILDNLSDAPSQRLPYSDTLPLYTINAGYPNISSGGLHPYQKSFEVKYLRDSIGKTTHKEWVYVVGQRPRANTFTTGAPEMPLFILRDPPGDHSYSQLTETSVISTAHTTSTQYANGGGLFADVNLGTKIVTNQGVMIELVSTMIHKHTISTEVTSTWTNNSIHEAQTIYTTTNAFGTSALEFDVGQKSDLYVGGAMNYIYGVTDILSIEGSEVKIDQELIIAPDGFETTYIYTESHIEDVIIPSLHLIGDEESAQDWEGIIALNQSLKNGAEFIENFSFNAGPTFSRSVSTTKSETHTKSFETHIAEEVRVQIGFKFNGAGSVGGPIVSFSQTIGKSDVNSEENTTENSFTLNDDDPYDFISVDVKSDRVYGTPVFTTISGETMCPHEENTLPRQGCEFGQKTFEMYGWPADQEVVFDGFQLKNTGQGDEDMEYELLVQNASNPYGAIIKVAGNIISGTGPLTFNIPANGLLEMNVSIARPQGDVYDFEGLKLQLRSPCESGPGFSDTATFNVHFTPPCSPVSLLQPLNFWVANQENNGTLDVVIGGYDLDNPQLKLVGLEYTSANGNNWINLLTKNRNQISGITIPYTWAFGNRYGPYRLRAFTECFNGERSYSMIAEGVIDNRPPEVLIRRPSNGVLNCGDEISFTFNEKLNPSTVTYNNVQLLHPASGEAIDFDLQFDQDLKKVFLSIDPQMNYFIEDSILQAEVSGVKDLYGNLLDGKDSIVFKVNQGPLSWSPNSYTKYIDVYDSIRFTSTLLNSSSKTVQYFVLLPEWLSADQPLSGELSGPGGSVEYEFLSDSLTGLLYKDNIFVSMLGFPKEPLPLEIHVNGGGTIDVSPRYDSVASVAGDVEFTVTISGGTSWGISENEEWILGDGIIGTGNGTFTIVYDENFSYYPRTAEIRVMVFGMPDFVVTITQDGAEPPLKIDPYIREVENYAGNTTFNVISDNPWIVDNIADWLAVSPMEGTGNETLTVAYTEDTAVAGRLGNFSVIIENVYEVVAKVKQQGADTLLNLNPENLQLIALDGDTSIVVTANCSWQINESLDWLGIYPNSGIGNDTLSVYYFENTSAVQRSGVISASVVGIPNVPWIDIMVTQNGPPPSLAVDTTWMDVPATFGNVMFNIESNTSWTVSTNADWLSPVTANGNGDGTLSVYYTENTLAEARTGKIFLTAEGLDTIPLTINQEAAAIKLEAAPLYHDMPARAGSSTIHLTCSIEWEAELTESWFSINTASGLGNEIITIYIEENISVIPRSGQIVFSADTLPEVVVTINQAGAEIELSVDPDMLLVNPTSGSITFDVASNVSWMAWWVDDWFTLEPSVGIGNGTVTINYQDNASANQRIGGILVWASGGLNVVVTLIQEGAATELNITPGDQEVTAAAGNIDFEVISNASWTVSEAEGWISVDPAGSSGNNSFTANYDENTTPLERVGSITVSANDGAVEKVVTITQVADTNLSVTPETQEVLANSVVTTFSIIANTSWQVSESAEWISGIDPLSGSGDGTLTVNYPENTSIISRNGNITVSGEGVPDVELSVNQAAADPMLTVNPVFDTVPPVLGTTLFAVSSNIDWTVEPEPGGNDWFTIDPGPGSGNGIITIEYEENTSINPRQGNITVSDGDELSVELRITQLGATPTLVVSPDIQNVSAPSTSTDFTVTSNIAWTVTHEVPWFAFVTGGGSDNGTINATYSQNTTVEQREGDITISGDGVDDAIVTVSQAGADPVLLADPDTLDVTAPAGDTIFDITCNTSWSITESADWFNVITVSGSGNAIITISLQENPLAIARADTITISAGELDARVTIRQAGAEPTIEVTPPSRDVGAAVGSITFEVVSNAFWEVSESENWLSVSPNQHTGDETLIVNYDENVVLEQRTGFITISVDGLENIVVAVIQAGADPVLTVNPTSLNVSANADSFIANVNSNTSWTVTANDTWLSAGPMSGSGDGSITVNYENNPSFDPRTGTITFSAAGTTDVEVAVTQEGFSPMLEVNPTIRNVTAPVGTTFFNVISNTDWIVEVDVGWLEPGITGGNGDVQLNVNYEENTMGAGRIGNITFKADGCTDVVVKVSQDGLDPILVVIPDNRVVTYNAGSAGFDVSSNVSWVVTESVAWLSVNPTNGIGTGAIIVDYLKNKNTVPRTGFITISSAGLSDATVSVTQLSFNPIIIINPPSQNVMAPSGFQGFDISSNTSWSVTESVDWLSIDVNNGTGNGVLTATYDGNASVNERTGEIIFLADGIDDVVATLIQEGADPELLANPVNEVVTAFAGSTSIQITSNTAWTVIESEDWLSVDPISDSGNGILNVIYDENTSLTPRVGSITVAADDVPNVVVTISQAGANPQLILSPPSQDVIAIAGATTFDVASNLDWMVWLTDDWLSVDPNSGSGDGSILVNFDENMSFDQRQGSILVWASAGPSVMHIITQAGANPVLVICPEQQDVAANSGNASFDVTSNTSWTVNESEDWLIIDPISGEGNSTLTATYDENNSGMLRIGEITLTGFGGSLVAVATLNQNNLALHTVNLPLGWSGLSSYLMPTDAAIQSVYGEILDELVIAITEEGIFYPMYNINTIGNWTQHSAYKVKTNSGVSINISGEMEDNKALVLDDGWNLIPVISTCQADVETLFEPVMSDLIIVKEVAGYRVYWPGMGVNNLLTLNPGEAYYVLMDNEMSMNFEICLKNTVIVPKFSFEPNWVWNEVISTSSNHVIGILEQAMVEFDHGDYIGVFNQEGICAGQIIVDTLQPQTALVAFGNDEYETQKQGFNSGEIFNFKYFQAATGNEYELFAEFDLSQANVGALFMENGISVVTGFKKAETGLQGYFTTNFVIFPNPTTGKFIIMGIDEDAVIDILDSRGQLVQSEISKTDQGCEMSLYGKRSGIYMVRVFTNNQYLYKKLILN